jgi:hypothetical protein
MRKSAVLFVAMALLSGQAGAAELQPKVRIIEKQTRYGTINYPQLSGLADKNIEQSINQIILDEAAQWNCDFDGERKDTGGMDYNVWTTVRLIDESHFSYTVGKDYYCGGAHPNQQTDMRNYDLKTGAPVPINGLLVPEMMDEKLSAYLLKDHKFEVEGCEDAYTDINWDYYRTKDNIVFLPRLAWTSPCVEEFPVPVAELKDYMWQELEEDRD